MRVFALVPAYQAKETVAQVVNDLLPLVERVVVVDDGSSDTTAEVARAAGAKVLQHLVNRGYGAALETGHQYALRQGAEAVVHFDADGQFSPMDLPKLIAALLPGKASAVLGSRFLGQAINIPAVRKFTLKLAIIFTWATTGVRLSDAHNGLRAFTREALELMHIKQDRMAASSEIIQELADNHIPIKEVPVTVTYTDYSLRSSKQGALPAAKIVKDLLIGKFLR